MLVADLAQGGKFTDAGVSENNINPPFALTVSKSRQDLMIGDVAPNGPRG
jgi:hypothetical protein